MSEASERIGRDIARNQVLADMAATAPVKPQDGQEWVWDILSNAYVTRAQWNSHYTDTGHLADRLPAGEYE